MALLRTPMWSWPLLFFVFIIYFICFRNMTFDVDILYFSKRLYTSKEVVFLFPLSFTIQ